MNMTGVKEQFKIRSRQASVIKVIVPILIRIVP